MYRLDQPVGPTPRHGPLSFVQAPGFAADLLGRLAHLTARLGPGLSAASGLAFLMAVDSIGWLARLERTHHPPAPVAIDQPPLLALLEQASANLQAIHDQVRARLDHAVPQPDWTDLLERVERANESLRRVIAGLG
jgi:hypothetical protein